MFEAKQSHLAGGRKCSEMKAQWKEMGAAGGLRRKSLQIPHSSLNALKSIQYTTSATCTPVVKENEKQFR